MSNITDKEIEKLAIKAYGNDFVRGEGYIAGYKQRLWEEAALQNKVSDPVKILSEKEFNSIISTELFNNIRSSQFKKGMYAGYLETVSKEYVSVNKSNDNIPTDFKQVTGHDSPKEMMAYEKGREDEQQVIIEWIEKWDGSSNSVMGALLKKKFNELFTYPQ